MKRYDAYLTISRASMLRYNRITNVLCAMDPQAIANVYEQLEPKFEEAQREIGWPDHTFRDVSKKAILHLLEMPIPRRTPVLESESGALYRLKDPNLESLSAAQKHLLRMGPRNARAMQRQLRAIGEATRLLPKAQAATE